MSIRPVDLQVMVQKTVEVGKMDRNEAARPEVAQQQFAEKLQKEVAHHDQHVTDTNKTEQQNVDENGRGGGYGGRRRRKNKDGKEEDKKDSNKSGSMFDVTI